MKWTEKYPSEWGETLPDTPPETGNFEEIVEEPLNNGVVIRDRDDGDAFVYAMNDGALVDVPK
jgi:hypothetical protein